MTWPQGTQRWEKWQNTCSWKTSKAHNVCFLLLLWQWSVSSESSALLTVFEHFFSQEVIDFIAQGFQVLCKTFCSTFFPQIHFYLFPLFEKSTVACFFWYFLLHSKDFSFSSSTSLLSFPAFTSLFFLQAITIQFSLINSVFLTTHTGIKCIFVKSVTTGLFWVH